MDEPAIEPKPEQPAPNVNMQKLKCTCGHEFETKTPVAEVINSALVSQIIWVHPEDAVCPACGNPHRMICGGATQVIILWKPVEVPQKRLIVQPPAGFDASRLKG